MYLAELPGELDAQVGALDVVGSRQLESRDLDGAFSTFESMYRLLLAAQPLGMRFHKGHPLHNMGLARILDGDGRDGTKFTLLAFVEDALSEAELHPESFPELDEPAARNLVYALSLPGPALAGVARRVRDWVRSGAAAAQPEVMRDPAWVAELMGLQDLIGAGQVSEPTKRLPGQMASPWDRRVFVGGSYQGHLAEVAEIANIARARGFDAIVETDFDVPDEHIHHHALMLLHECRWAIFEVTTQAGQLMELERTFDYGIVPLVLIQGTAEHGRTSEMIRTHIARLGIRASKYADMAELHAAVDAYLDEAEAILTY